MPAVPRRITCLAAVLGTCALAGTAGASPAAAAGGLRRITVDASKAVGTLRSLQGVSGTPLPGDDSHPDYTAQDQQMGVDIVRTHDVDCKGTSDIDGAGPNRIFPDWAADPNDPHSYNFGPTDRAVLSIARSGAQVEYSLGHSDLTCAGITTNNVPPPDPGLYAIVARHVAQHYNDGWDDGYHLHIRYWEIWNEPDLLPFWSGTSSQFYALYADTARALKSLHPWMQVGGPALTTNNDLTGFRQSLLGYIRANHLPLDFFSIHHYTDFTEDPLDFVRLGNEYRSLLDRMGFAATSLQLTEWNYGIVDTPTSPQRAAFVADSLIYMQSSPLQRAFYYRANGAGPVAGWALIGQDGSLSRTGDAYAAVGSLERTPVRLASSGGDQSGLAVEAGRSTGQRREIRVLVSNYEIPAADQGPFPPFIVDNTFSIPNVGTFTLLPRRAVTYADNAGYDLTVQNIAGGQEGLVVRRYRVDDTHALTLIGSSIQHAGSVHLSAALPAPAVELIVITPLR